MDNTKSSARPHLITRGNVDGLVSSSIFLRCHPGSRISFVSTPTACVRLLSTHLDSNLIYLVDIPQTPAILSAVKALSEMKRVVSVDHHPSSGVVRGREGSSAAGLLHSHFHSDPSMESIVALADLLEGNDSAILDRQMALLGRRRVESEAKILDFSWRLDVHDDPFRLVASRELSCGLLPSQIPAIIGRYQEVMSQGRWTRALERARKRMRKVGEVGVLDFGNKKRSLYGFGSRACSEVAREKGCKYAALVQGQGESASVSLRRLDDPGIHLGEFVEDFTRHHGICGGGHAMSAGGRISSECAPLLIDELISLA